MDIDLRQFDEIPPVSRDMWEEAVAKALGTQTLDRLRTITSDGIAVPPISAPRSDREPLPARGAGKPWSIVQRIALEEPARDNERVLEELSGGADAIDLVFPRSSTGPVAWAGDEDVSPKLIRVFESVYLDMITVHLTGVPAVLNIAKRLLEVVESSGRPGCLLRLRLNEDPLVCAIDTHANNPIQDGIIDRTIGNLKLFAERNLSGSAVTAGGQFWHGAGASESQQLAIAVATGVAYLRLSYKPQAPDAGEIAKRIEFRLVADQNQFLTMAKLRAFRRLWALVLDESGLPASPAFVHAETAWRMMTRRDPWVNILRSTIATFAAAVGGADAITTVPHTALLGAPDAAARRLSRNVQTVLMDESNLHRVADPAAGAGGIEDLTDFLAAAAWEEFRRIEREGGLVASWNSGALRGRIAAVDEKRKADVARRRLPLTGTSTYPLLSERSPEVLPGDPLPAPGPGVHRLAEPWEALRDRSDALLAATGRRPSVFLANLGPVAAFTTRATWAKNLFEAGGIEAVGRDGHAEAAALAEAFRASGATVACLCSDDRTYETMGAAAAAALKAAGASEVLLAGRPKDGEAALREAGVDRFVHEGLDMLALLGELSDRIGAAASATTH